jgi:hypothetical protein
MSKTNDVHHKDVTPILSLMFLVEKEDFVKHIAQQK